MHKKSKASNYSFYIILVINYKVFTFKLLLLKYISNNVIINIVLDNIQNKI